MGSARPPGVAPVPGPAGQYAHADTNRYANTDRYGHSAIVRYVAGETLYTVEGNSRGEVRLRHYYHWRLNQRIDGFGIVTQVEPRVAQLQSDSAQDERARRGLDEEADERRRDRARP